MRATVVTTEGSQLVTYDGKRRVTRDCEVLQAYLLDSLCRAENLPSYALGGCSLVRNNT
jgi:hypothetical protein